MLPLILTVILYAAPTIPSGTTFSAEVVAITDGDTIKVLKDDVPIRVRLWGIDAPEKKQAFGTRAKEMGETWYSGLSSG